MTLAMINSSSGLSSPAWNRNATPSTARSGDSFATLMASAGASGDRENLRRAATEFVSSALLVPVFSSLRQSPLAPREGPLAPGAAEKRFGPLLDQRCADQIAQASRFSLIETIVNRFAPPPAKSDPTHELAGGSAS